ncbi:hypothetical protein [Halosimplex pelagicum]|uniref:Uncharacterized protein n=1 Tax=Halosimplex pelagicum TaxID=869886 RepID=A0A7D5P6W8_9EURY|nr:hypothetical protein [Halosimplex pelagicum]QLH82266.1 hypothetical protein HZS54_11875 [Halosimplex pelagicum]
MTDTTRETGAESNEPNNESTDDPNPHLVQTHIREWHSWEVAGEKLVAYDVPEGTVRLYRVVSASRNVRAFASADAALYDGSIVDTFYDEQTNTIEFIHEYAGRKGSHRPAEWLDNPALRLERLPPGDHDILSPDQL